ncbi:MAG: glycosyltransferase family 2 protein [Planctomycetota bacterium]
MLNEIFTACAALTIPGTIELAALTAFSLRNRRRPRPHGVPDLSGLRIVVPAHDEEEGIGSMLDDLLLKLPSGADMRQVLVVADNCSDRTADVARSRGVRVLERHVKAKRGKGQALEEAFTQLIAHDPEAAFFVVLDADSRLGPGAIDQLFRAYGRGAEAVQASYRVADPDASARAGLLNLAWLCFNHLRPLGRAQIGFSAGVLGNGFGLSREALLRAPYRAGSVVEDLEYHLRLLRTGVRVEFVPEARVLAKAAPSAKAERKQRARWEGGRLRMAFEHLPRLLWDSVRGQYRFIEPALDLMLAPLAFHSVLLALGIASGGWGNLVAAIGFSVLLAHVLVAAFAFGRGANDLQALVHAPFYVLRKLTMLPAIVKRSGRDAEWERTDRAA